MVSFRRHARYWGAYLAGGGLVLVFGLFLWNALSEKEDINKNWSRRQISESQKGALASLPSRQKTKDTACNDACISLRTMEAAEEQAEAAIVSVIISVLGIGGVVGTLIYTAKAAIAASRAATLAERALTDLERPRVFVWSEGRIECSDIGYPALCYSVANFGRSAAIIRRTRVIVGIDDSGHIPEPRAVISAHSLVKNPVLDIKETRSNISVHIPDKLVIFLVSESHPDDDGEPRYRLRGDAPAMFFRVTIDYDGPHTTGHETAIVLRYENLPLSFVPWGGKKYNYNQ